MGKPEPQGVSLTTAQAWMEASVSMSVGAMCRGASWLEVVAVTAEGCVSKAAGIAQRGQEAGQVGLRVGAEWREWGWGWRGQCGSSDLGCYIS